MPWANDGGNQWNALRCAPVAGDPAAPGEACAAEGSSLSGIDNCDETSFCFFVDPDTLQGTCMPFCGGSENAPICDDVDTTCAITNEGTITLCLPTCDPLGDDCGALEGCWGYETFFCFPDHSEDTGAYGDACAALNECDAGLVCGDADFVPGCVDQSCCTPYCNLADADPDATCPGYADGQVCVSWFVDPPPLFESVGACILPD
jgi:hypothetical protein